MMPLRRAIAAALACLLVASFAGCPGGGFYGRYIVLNSSKEPIENLVVSVNNKQKKWAVTEPGEGWITPRLTHVPMQLDVAWTTQSGKQKHRRIDFSEPAGYRYTGDLIIEFEVDGAMRWRLAEH
jgi:hypothetical protein